MARPRNYNFMLKAQGCRERILSTGVTCKNLYLEKFTPQPVWRGHGMWRGPCRQPEELLGMPAGAVPENGSGPECLPWAGNTTHSQDLEGNDNKKVCLLRTLGYKLLQ